MLLLEWLYANWLDLIQSVGIVASLLLGALTLQIDTRVRRVQNLFAITKQHREIWLIMLEHSTLTRVIESRPNTTENPVTEEEKFFVRFLILHLKSVYHAAKNGFYVAPEGLIADVRFFFNLPIPSKVWDEDKQVHDAEFVRFVDQLLTK